MKTDAASVWGWRETVFEYAGTIEPDREPGGALRLLMPQNRYAKKDTVFLNKYGAGPFCRFRVHTLPHASGVYVYLIEGRPVYVGRAEDLHARFYAYGNISPKNCYKGGRETNCRINTLIYKTYVVGGSILVYTHVTKDYVSLEATMIANLRPEWNRSGYV